MFASIYSGVVMLRLKSRRCLVNMTWMAIEFSTRVNSPRWPLISRIKRSVLFVIDLLLITQYARYLCIKSGRWRDIIHQIVLTNAPIGRTTHVTHALRRSRYIVLRRVLLLSGSERPAQLRSEQVWSVTGRIITQRQRRHVRSVTWLVITTARARAFWSITSLSVITERTFVCSVRIWADQ